MQRNRQTEAIAAEWLARRDGGNWTNAEQSEFTEWLGASTANRVAFLRLEAAWQQAGRLRALGTTAQSTVIPPPRRWSAPPVLMPVQSEFRQVSAAGGKHPDKDAAGPSAGRGWSRLHFLAAAVLVGAAIGASWHFSWPDGSSYRTDVGGLVSVPMPDGSNVTLNTDSEIRVAVTEKERRVDLSQGEAFFEVAHDPVRPFVVYAGDRRIVAVGTKFAVRRETAALRVIVTEGRVRVEQTGDGDEALAMQLSAGAVALAGQAGTLVEERASTETEEYLSWRHGFLVFRESTLGEAIAEFNRYNIRKIVIADPAVATIRIGGKFRATNVDAFIRLIEHGFPVRAERHDRQIVLKAA